MQTYQQAASILDSIGKGLGTPKTLCLKSSVQKKRRTFALVSQTLLYTRVIDRLINKVGLKQEPGKENLLRVLVYDAALGSGIPKLPGIGWVVLKHAKALKSSLGSMLQKIHSKNPIDLLPRDRAALLPVYAHVNTLLTTPRAVIDTFIGQGWLASGTFTSTSEPLQTFASKLTSKDAPASPSHTRRSGWASIGAPGEVARCNVLPQLLCFPTGTKLSLVPPVSAGLLLPMDRASCLPPSLLCSKSDSLAGTPPGTGIWPPPVLIDAAAAPGNKTLLALGLMVAHYSTCSASRVPPAGVPEGAVAVLWALDRNPVRAKSMAKRLRELSGCPSSSADDLKADPREIEEAATGEAAEGLFGRSDCIGGRKRKREVMSVSVARASAALRKSLPVSATKDGPEPYVVDAFIVRKSPACGGVAVHVVCGDFLCLNPSVGPLAEAGGILLDPSCSGLGHETYQVTTASRLQGLAKLQFRLLSHALKFAHCRRVVYSTCSASFAENEGVVSEVLAASSKLHNSWNIVPAAADWVSRGLDAVPAEGDLALVQLFFGKVPVARRNADQEQLAVPHSLSSAAADVLASDGHHALRSYPSVDRSRSFFVAVLDAGPASSNGRASMRSIAKPKTSLFAPKAAEESEEEEDTSESADGPALKKRTMADSDDDDEWVPSDGGHSVATDEADVSAAMKDNALSALKVARTSSNVRDAVVALARAARLSGGRIRGSLAHYVRGGASAFAPARKHLAGLPIDTSSATCLRHAVTGLSQSMLMIPIGFA